MKVTTLYKDSFTGSKIINYQVHNMDLKAILLGFTYDADKKNYITVTLRNEKGSTVLMNRIPIPILMDITDAEMGIGRLNGNGISDISRLAYIELDCKVDDEDELNIMLELDNGVAAGKVNITGLEDSFTHHPRKYELSMTKNEIFKDVEKLYIYKDTGFDYTNLDGQLTVKTEDTEKSASLESIMDYFFVNNNFEAINAETYPVIAEIYSDDDETFEDVSVNFVGNTFDAYLCITRVEQLEKLSKSTIKAAEKAIRKVSNIRRRKPNKYRHLKHAGKIPSLTVLRQARSIMSVKR